MAQHSVASRRANLAWVYQELLTAIVRLRFNRQSVPNADAFRNNMRELIRMAAQNAQSMGYSSESVKLATYALVAFLDESVLLSRNPIFSSWAGKPLQEELFGQAIAGNTFYDSIQNLLGRPDSAEAGDLLEVFYLCLLLGYRGRYGVGGAGELHAIMQNMKDKLRRIRGNDLSLSPSWALPSDPILAPPKDPRRHLFWAVAAVSLIIAVGTFGGFKIALSTVATGIRALSSQTR